MPSIWNDSPKKKRPRKGDGYEGNAGQLLDYSLTHTSPRALRKLRVDAEVRRTHKEGQLASVTEIQARHNFTEEAAQSFLRSVKRALQSNPVAKTKVPSTRKGWATGQGPTTGMPPSAGLGVDLASAPSLPAPPWAPAKSPLEFAEQAPIGAPGAELHTILQNIRARYGDEIRTHGEQTSVREGFVYLVTHPCFEGWVKAGMTIDYELRMTAYNVSDPMSRFALVAARWVADRREAERRLLYALSEHAKEMRGEWARLELTTAQTALATL